MPRNSSGPRDAKAGGHRANFDISETRLDRDPALVVQAVVPDDAPADAKDAIAVRRLTNLHGVCPDCRAVRTVPNRAQRRAAVGAGRMITTVVVHEEDCTVLCDDDRRWS